MRGLLHLKGAAIFAAATWGYFALLDGSWIALLALILVPDLSMVGYLRGPRLGAWTYNLVHPEALPVVVLAVGLAADSRAVLLTALVLTAHIGMDPAAGYRLKFSSGFKHTHLQRLS